MVDLTMATSQNRPPTRIMPRPPILQLTLHEGTNLVSTAKSIADLIKLQRRRNKVIHEVLLIMDPSFRMELLLRGEEPCKSLLMGLGKVSKRFTIRGHFYSPFPVSAVTTLLSEVSTLACFSLCRMVLVGSDSEFQRLADVIGRHNESLETFDIDMIHLQPVVHQEGAQADLALARNLTRGVKPLDPLLKMISKTKRLHSLSLGGCNAASLNLCATFSTLEELFHSRVKIERLSLINFPLSYSQMCQIAKVVETNDSLKHLCLSCEALPVTKDKKSAVTSPDSDALKRMLHVNKTLEKVVLYIANLNKDDGLSMELMSSIRRSSTIKKVFLGNLEQMSPQCSQALLQMLRSNYSIEEFGFVCSKHGLIMSAYYPCPMEMVQEITMLLKLNKDANRGKLLSSTLACSNAQWVNSLIAVKDDFRCLYHLLSLNPSLIICRAPSYRKSHCRKRRIQTREDLVSQDTNPESLPLVEERLQCSRKRLYRSAKYSGASYRWT